MSKSGDKQVALITLQFMVGVIVTGGGSAFTFFALNRLGTALGLIHLVVGVTNLVAGFTLIVKRDLPRMLLIVLNTVTATYSTLSESLVQAYSLLPQGPSSDSIIGTAVAILLNLLIIYLSLKRKQE